MPYSRTTWQDSPSVATAITAARLNNMEQGIVNAYIAGTGGLVNADIAVGAAIAYAKLALTGSILNADLAGSIAYSKLVLTGAILNADLAGSIAYAKLVLTGSVVNADISASAAIPYSKLSYLSPAGAPATSLPGSPTDGQLSILTDSTTVPTYSWLFQWSSTASKWYFVGGGPAYVAIDTTESSAGGTNVFADFTTVGPSFTVPRAGKYDIRYGGRYGANGSAAQSYMGLSVAGAAPSTSDRTSIGTASTAASNPASEYVTGAIASSSVCKLQSADGNTGSRTAWGSRYISVTPIYVT